MKAAAAAVVAAAAAAAAAATRLALDFPVYARVKFRSLLTFLSLLFPAKAEKTEKLFHAAAAAAAAVAYLELQRFSQLKDLSV